jgi:hypothetical protein
MDKAKTHDRMLIAAIAGAQSLLLGSCAWLGLSWGSLTYPSTQPGEAANVALHGEWAYVTRGTVGLEVLRTGRVPHSRLLAPPAGLESIDDVAVADGFLFVLDAQAPGHLAVLSLADPAAPRAVGEPVDASVGAFAGVTAANGRVIVAGGNAPLAMRGYDAEGRLGAIVASRKLGQGQADAVLAPDGELGFVPKQDWGPNFELAVVRTSLQPPRLEQVGALPLETFGFTPGGAKPASFPIAAATEGALLYVASAAGLEIVDVSDAADPRLLARIDPGVLPVSVDVRDGLVAVVGSDPAPRLVLVDAHDPSQPRVLQSFALPEGSRATGIVLTDSQAVVAAHGHGVQLFDLIERAWRQIARPLLYPDPAGV